LPRYALRFEGGKAKVGQPVAKIQLAHQMKPKAGGLPLVYGYFFLKET
jgi:hypothetical protein